LEKLKGVEMDLHLKSVAVIEEPVYVETTGKTRQKKPTSPACFFALIMLINVNEENHNAHTNRDPLSYRK
jgi:hypothetical protein